PERLLPGLLDDPSLELRRDAVAQILDQAEKLHAAAKKAEALPLFSRAFTNAREKDQIDKAVRRLRELGEKIDLPRHLGLLLDWKLLGPFADPDQKGYDTVFPPEKQFDLATVYEGKKGKIRWQDHVSKDEYGLVDLNAVLGKDPPAVAFAWTEFTSKEERP